MKITARQFAFVSIRLLALYLAVLTLTSLPILFATLVTTFQATPNEGALLWVMVGSAIAVWAIAPTCAYLLWARAADFTCRLLEEAPPAVHEDERIPWETRVLSLAGVLTLADLIPRIVQQLTAIAALKNFADYSPFMHVLPTWAGMIAQFVVGIALTFHPSSAWDVVQRLRTAGVSRPADR